MRIVVSNRVRLEGLDIADPVHEQVAVAIRARFTYDNPVYWDARRFRRPCRNIPRRIELFEDVDGTGTCPRGALADVLRIAAPLQAEVVDETVFPPCTASVCDMVLRDYQSAAVDAIVAARQGVLQAPTGSGKTVVALALIARL